MTLQATGISKKYYRPTKTASHFEAVKPLGFTLEEGKLTEITGRSGSGKSTLLYMLAGLLKPSAGSVVLDGKDLYSLGDEELSRLRNEKFGVIPQGQTGLFALTVLQNVLAPVAIYGDTKKYEEKARELLELVGISELAESKMTELSGGEMRRMSIARALIMNPDIIFADEPTDDLDDENTKAVLEFLQKTAHSGKSVLLVTHEASAADYADKIFRMDAGVLTLL
ncbi:MAG: ABC transporter ATP-binding protein [Treponema sp.]|nr:ABC transporter ATP-binding protein [Treponema sp.]